MTRLVTVAHGTRHAPFNEVARWVTARAGELLGVEATCSYVELCAPLFADVVPASSSHTVVVPLLLSTGHHLRVDLPAVVSSAPGAISLGPSLGPDPLLAEAQVARLVAAGALPGQPVVMVAAGSNDPLAMRDLTRAVLLLESAWGGPVELATLGGHGVRPAEVARPGTAVSPYLLAEGHFAQRTRAECALADVVASVIGPHQRVVDLVVARAEGLIAERRSA